MNDRAGRESYGEARRDRLLGRKLARMSDRICNLILFSDLAWVDICIEIEKMRAVAEEAMPERADWFERIYESRFERLWEQWRAPVEEYDFWSE